ncbi:peptidoglycan recognition protein [Streptomyces sp. NPDC088789]|uniref:peptidoglycan recognition protein family protein n=1 Tax=Streptomyces sp. NPDC088789 TaxID=3365899 RepID=UPI00380C5C99
MRGYLASAIGVTCVAALALPLTLPQAAEPSRPAPGAAVLDGSPGESGASGRTGTDSSDTTDSSEVTDSSEGTDTSDASGVVGETASDGTDVSGSTESLALAPLSRDRALGATLQGLGREDVQRFSLLGVIWDDPDAELNGSVQVRTRSAATGVWSEWQDLETHNAEHAADPDTAERSSGRVRGATAPLWVGDSDGVEVRVQAQADNETEAAEGATPTPKRSLLPAGLRIELIDPGITDTRDPADTDDPTGTGGTGSTGGTGGTGGTDGTGGTPAQAAAAEPLEYPALTRAETEQELLRESGGVVQAGAAPAQPYLGPRPKITTRKGWGADEGLREKGFVYTNKVKAAFVHHTATGNNYTCAEAPSVIRGIYRYHVKSMGWRDIGYNFLVDKCGNIYEGRAGGVAKAVLGAHTLGFNSDSMGIAAIGSYGPTKPSNVAVTAIARLGAWKLGIWGGNPKGTTYLTSGGGNLYKKGKNVRLNVISGHRDGFSTECPGAALYGKLGTVRTEAARLQGR